MEVPDVALFMCAWWLRRPAVFALRADLVAAAATQSRSNRNGNDDEGNTSHHHSFTYGNGGNASMVDGIEAGDIIPLAVVFSRLAARASLLNIRPFLFDDGLLTVLILANCTALLNLAMSDGVIENLRTLNLAGSSWLLFPPSLRRGRGHAHADGSVGDGHI